MTQTILSIAIIACVGTALILLLRELQVRLLNARVSRTVTGTRRTKLSHTLMRWLSALGMRFRRFYHPDNLEQLKMVVQTAGYNPHRVMPIIIASKTLTMLLVPLLAVVVSIGSDWTTMLFTVLLATVFGIMGPRLLLRMISRRFNVAIERGTPDAIDLLVVCSEAGMGLESGLERVAREINRSNPPMNRVLNGLLDDLRVLPNRQDAFANLSARSTCDGLRRFGTMISQSLQYGTPLGAALRAIAEELRRDRITKLEERAHKLGAKLIIPMVMFMLPAMFITLAGSPALHLLESLRAISQ